MSKEEWPTGKREESAPTPEKYFEKRIQSAQTIEELLAVINSVESIHISEGRSIPAKFVARAIEDLAYQAPELRKSEVMLDHYLSKRGVTRNFGIRDKVIDIYLSE